MPIGLICANGSGVNERIGDLALFKKAKRVYRRQGIVPEAAEGSYTASINLWLAKRLHRLPLAISLNHGLLWKGAFENRSYRNPFAKSPSPGVPRATTIQDDPVRMLSKQPVYDE